MSLSHPHATELTDERASLIDANLESVFDVLEAGVDDPSIFDGIATGSVVVMVPSDNPVVMAANLAFAEDASAAGRNVCWCLWGWWDGGNPMRHQEYIEERQARDAGFEGHRAVARAELELSRALAQQREALELSHDDLCRLTGIDVTRIEAIEEGDTISLNEILWLCHALNLHLSVDQFFELRVTPSTQASGSNLHRESSSILTVSSND